MFRGLQTANSQYLLKAGILLFFVVCAAETRASSFFNFNAGKEGAAVCRLVGKVRPLVPSSESSGFGSLKNKIKMRFDADDPQKCQTMIRVYCEEHIKRARDVPDGLRGYFIPAYDPKDDKRKRNDKGEVLPTHKYEVTEGCKIIVE